MASNQASGALGITSRDIVRGICSPGEHEWDAARRHERVCTRCGKVRLQVLVSQNGQSAGEYTAMIPGDSERAAVDYFLRFARIDLEYRFLGESGFVSASDAAGML